MIDIINQLKNATVEELVEVSELLEFAQGKLIEAKIARNKIEFDANMKIANEWWDIAKPTEPKNREEALTYFETVKLMKETETDLYRSKVLTIQLTLANEKYKELKKLEPKELKEIG
jgi:hypothetical protein